jgi:hypothetical protein
MINLLNTNSFALDLEPGEVSALHTIGSLFNHSCSPNIQCKISGVVRQFVALRNISTDEQLFISYVDATLPPKDRIEALVYRYGFLCKCFRCSSEITQISKLERDNIQDILRLSYYN